MLAFLGKVIGVIFASFLLGLAYQMLNKGKEWKSAFVAVLSVVVLLSCFNWFQGWAKSVMTTHILSKLEFIGQQVNTVQETTALMLNDLSNQVSIVKQTNALLIAELSNHQTAIDSHQKELDKVQGKIIGQELDITNQFHTITLMTSNLNTLGTNLDDQTKKLSTVEYWVHNIFDNMTNEAVYTSDTNRVFSITLTNKSVCYFVRLDHAPIINSVEAYARDGNSLTEVRMPSSVLYKNIITIGGYGFNTNSTSIYLKYVIDTRETNLFYQLHQDWLSISPDGTSPSLTYPINYR